MAFDGKAPTCVNRSRFCLQVMASSLKASRSRSKLLVMLVAPLAWILAERAAVLRCWRVRIAVLHTLSSPDVVFPLTGAVFSDAKCESIHAGMPGLPSCSIA